MSPSSALRSINAIANTKKNERVKQRSLDEDNVDRQKDEKSQKEESPSSLFSVAMNSCVPDNQIASNQESSLQSRINLWLANPHFFPEDDLKEEFVKIITDFNTKGLLTQELLASTTQDGPYKGVNIVWLLAYHGQWEILISLKDQGLLTKELLASTAQDGRNKGTNVVWHLAANNQWEILISLNDKGLLTKELLASTRQENEFCFYEGLNVVWILAYYEQWEVLISLKDQGLLTQELLASTAQNGDDKGKNAVWFLAANKQWEILISLNDKNLLNSIHFETKFNNQNALEELLHAAEEAGNLNPSKLNFINKLLLKIEEIDEYTLLMLNGYLNLVLQREKNTPSTKQVNYSDAEKLFLTTLRKKIPVWINAPQPNRNIFSALFYSGEREYPKAFSIVTSYQLTEDALLEISTPARLPNVLIDLIQKYKGN